MREKRATPNDEEPKELRRRRLMRARLQRYMEKLTPEKRQEIRDKAAVRRREQRIAIKARIMQQKKEAEGEKSIEVMPIASTASTRCDDSRTPQTDSKPQCKQELPSKCLKCNKIKVEPLDDADCVLIEEDPLMSLEIKEEPTTQCETTIKSEFMNTTEECGSICKSEIIIDDSSTIHLPAMLQAGDQEKPTPPSRGIVEDFEKVKRDPQDDKRKYFCSLCDVDYFVELYLFREHLKTQHDGFRWKCPECGEQFKLIDDLNTHALKYGRKIFKCAVCEQGFYNYNSYWSHIRKHAGAEQYSCEYCDKTFKYKEYLNSHLLVHRAKATLKCEQCGAYFKNKSVLQYHMTKKHGEKKYQCDECPKMFYLVGDLKQHKVFHEPDQFVCEVCATSFKRKQTFEKHMQSHEKEKLTGVKSRFLNRRKGESEATADAAGKKFECNICSKRFKHNYLLRDHMYTHKPKDKPISEESKKYECPMCDRKFMTGFSLYQHKKSKTLHNRFECKICAVIIYGEKVYKKHMETHSGPGSNEN